MRIGCYLDQGCRNNEQLSRDVIALAEEYGFEPDGDLPDVEEDENGPEVLDDMENDAIQFLNDHSLTPIYAYWGHCGEAGAFGLWADIDGARESIEGDGGFISSKEQDYPADDYTGEWLHVNDHGNATLYVRFCPVDRAIMGMTDKEIWSLV